MILSILAVGAIVCAPTKFINKTDTWTDHDKKVLAFNKDFCKNKFKGSGCMTQFHKRAERVHWILCGEGIKNETILERIKLRPRQ